MKRTGTIMEAGWIYILTNPSSPDLVKVGLTTTSPQQRLKELSSATGVPTPFQLHKAFPVSDVRAAEAKAHAILAQIFGRPNEQREFFQTNGSDAEEVLKGALQAFIVLEEADAFQNAINLIKQSSHTFGCIEFEEVLRKKTDGAVANFSKEVAGMYGIYLAACIYINRPPLYPHFLETHHRHYITEIAIEHSEHLTDNAVNEVLDFVRNCR